MAYGTRSGRRAGYQRHDREKKPLRLWPIGILAACTLLAVAARSLLMPEPALSSIGAKAAIAVDVDSGRELVSKNAAERVYPASLTKLMTALLLSKYRTPDQEIRYGGAAALQEPVKLDLPPGSRLTAEGAMDAMLIGSANDVAYAIATDVGGSIQVFTSFMNSRAKVLGLHGTHFVNPHGLHDGNHYSTARDISKLFLAAMEDPWIAESLGKKDAEIEVFAPPPSQGDAGESYTVANTNPLLGLDGCVAGKTGFTTAAGRCLAAMFERDGKRLAVIVLGSPSEEALLTDVKAALSAALEELNRLQSL